MTSSSPKRFFIYIVTRPLTGVALFIFNTWVLLKNGTLRPPLAVSGAYNRNIVSRFFDTFNFVRGIVSFVLIILNTTSKGMKNSFSWYNTI